MMRKWLGITVCLVTAMALLNLGSCARSQKLIGITIQPSSFTFLTPDTTSTANFTALGTYIHPAETKDITSQVTWTSDIPQLVTVSGGTVSPATSTGCGAANISASSTQDTEADGIAIGYATVTVDNPLVSYCPGGSTAPVLSVSLQGPTNSGGTVTSVPTGINCPETTCGAAFTSGTSVTLTAAPSSSFVNWGTPNTCPVPSGNSCTVLVTANTTLTAVFQ
jgi:hypothetical protein